MKQRRQPLTPLAIPPPATSDTPDPREAPMPESSEPPPSGGKAAEEGEQAADRLAFRSALYQAWISTKVEKDRSLLGLQTAGIGTVVALYTTAHPVGGTSALLLGAAAVSFLVGIVTILLIFDKNADQIERILTTQTGIPNLRRLDRTANIAFVLGVALTLLGTISSAHEKGNTAMKNPILHETTKSFEKLDGLRPRSGEERIRKESLDGLDRLQPPPKEERPAPPPPPPTVPEEKK